MLAGLVIIGILSTPPDFSAWAVQPLQFLSAKLLSLVLRERPVSLAFSLAD
jgi:hypothetical protein